MFGFDDTSKCADGHDLCSWTYELTGNQRAAHATDVLIGRPLTIALLLILFFVVRWVLHRIVDRLVASAEDGVLPDRVSRIGFRGRAAQAAEAQDLATATRRVQRAKTMGDLLKSIITGLLIAVFGTMVLSELGVNIAPIVASAGIIGIALGFGAQSLVKDFLSGIFMIFEDQYGVGDVVDLGEATGTIEAVSLRVTRLRDLNGTVWYVPNGEVMRVGNMSQNWSRAVVDIKVGYHEDITRVKRVLREVAHDVWDDEDFKGIVIEEPTVTGVETFDPDGVTLRVLLKTAPMEQWAVARTFRERIKARFDHEHIEIAIPQQVVWHRDTPGAQAPDAATGPTPDGEEPVDG